MSFLVILLAGVVSTLFMVRAIGSILTGSYHNALVPGLVIQFGFGIFFSFIYFGILSYFNASIGLNGILGGGLMGLFHGVVVGFVGVITVAEHHPITKFKQAGFTVSVAHLFGHIVYGLTIGIFFNATGVRILV